ncbi:MAG: sigma-70 family RNA polymerase sigma factor [Isosphaeraceae bacterium]|nr:sigma-70 family RNA polymerase sigma factor [Isosphaeraceae bacterium]
MMKALKSDPDAQGDLDRETDEVLLQRYRDSGRPADFDELVRRYEKELYRYLARYVGDSALAEDVFQNTFLQVHLKRDLYEDGRAVRPWLYSIATHQAVDALRKAGRRAAVSLDQPTAGGSDDSDAGALVDMLTSDDATPLAELQDQERRDWVRKSVAALPDALRETLLLAYDKDLKYREIAELLRIPVGTVKSRLHAALTKLQEMARRTSSDRDS